MTNKQAALYLVLIVTVAGVIGIGWLTHDFASVLGASGVGSAMIFYAVGELKAEGEAERLREEAQRKLKDEAERSQIRRASDEDRIDRKLRELGLERFKDLEELVDEGRKDRDRLQSEIKRLNEEAEASKAKQAGLQWRIDDMQLSLTERGKEIEQLNAKITTLIGQVKALTEDNAKLKERDKMQIEEIARLNTALGAAQQALAAKETELQRICAEQTETLAELERVKAERDALKLERDRLEMELKHLQSPAQPIEPTNST